MTIDARFVLLWDFEFFEKQAIVLKLHTNILHPSRNFDIELGQNRFKRSKFVRF